MPAYVQFSFNTEEKTHERQTRPDFERQPQEKGQ